MNLMFLLLLTSVVCEQQSDDVLELIERAGFTGEAHHVKTEDGYVLKVHRILPRGKPVSNHPVFLMHGMMVTSAVFIMSGTKNSLGFFLADKGYDVWMGNTRGSKHSTNHTTLSTESHEYWTFSFHEMGIYDLPAMFEIMLKKTGANKFFYAGHSQGSTALLVLLSMFPKYNEKITQAHLMAPAAFTIHFIQPFSEILWNAIRDGLFSTYRYLNLELGWVVCQELFCSQPQGSPEFKICQAASLAIAGPNKRKIEMDSKVLQIYLRYMSPRIATMQLVHFVQTHFSKKFRTFDHSWKHFEQKNFTEPVDYNLSKVTVPTYLHVGTADAVVGQLDSKTLESFLPNVKKFNLIDDWNHFDFTYAKNAGKTLYESIIEDFKRNDNKTGEK